MTDGNMQICFWFEDAAEEAARFWCDLFPDSAIDRIDRAPSDYPGGKKGDVLTVVFTLLGAKAMGLNGRSEGAFGDAVSFQVFTRTQEETDRYWAALTEGGDEMACSWCYDRWGVRWQIVPRVLMDGLEHDDPQVRQRVFATMQQMVKIDHAKVEAAIAG